MIIKIIKIIQVSSKVFDAIKNQIRIIKMITLGIIALHVKPIYGLDPNPNQLAYRHSWLHNS